MNSFKKYTKNRTVVGVILLVVTMILIMVFIPLFNNLFSAKKEIVRFCKDVHKGSTITSDMIEVKAVGKYNLPTNVIIKSDEIIGKKIITDVFKGDIATTAKITDELIGVDQMLSRTNGNLQAISIPVSNVAGLLGNIQTGDIITINATGNAPQTFLSEPTMNQPANIEKNSEISNLISPTNSFVKIKETQYVEVIDSFNVNNVSANKPINIDGEKDKVVTSIMILCTPEQAEKLIYYTANGNLYATLACKNGNKNVKQELLEKQKNILNDLYSKPFNQNKKTSINESDNKNTDNA